MSVHIFGIRHHGPGSARRLCGMLDRVKPDIILVEGPPDAEPILSLIVHETMKPPVAILGYMPDAPQHGVFYPFAEFSPEWQAFKYGLQQRIPVKMMDLPLMHQFALDREDAEKKAVTERLLEEVNAAQEQGEGAGEAEAELTELVPAAQVAEQLPYSDPIAFLAHAAGYEDSELWWEHNFEQRLAHEETFEAIMEGMQALREVLPPRENHREILREAFMRKTIRAAQKEGYKNIVVVCGACHAPALLNMPQQKQDDELLKKLPKVKVETTWIPWTYDRLTFASGYGAGIDSPGWYHHLWDYPHDTGAIWLTKVAGLFRGKNMDTSVAHVIEGVRLAEMLAILRNLPRPGLYELNEATKSVLCFGDDVLLQLIENELIVSNRVGQVPTEAPKVPLQYDLESLQKKLRMPILTYEDTIDLDLRKDTDLNKSKLLHRLTLLGITWGTQEYASGKGTWKERWTLKWHPELWIKVIEKGVWGNTVEEAASKYVQHLAGEAISLSDVATLLEDAIPAELPTAIDFLMHRIDNLAAVSNDVVQLMQALPPLVQVMRYGNVRKTDAGMLSGVVDGLVTRICVGLPVACHSLDEDGAVKMADDITRINNAINLLQQEEHQQMWQHVLEQLSHLGNVHGRLAGCVCRLLVDARVMPQEEIESRFRLALSLANEPAYAAAWVEGFLKGSGMILLLDNVLWNILNQWVGELQDDMFVQLLPLLRRTFSTFAPDERRRLGEKAKGKDYHAGKAAHVQSADFDSDRGTKALDVISKLIGI